MRTRVLDDWEQAARASADWSLVENLGELVVDHESLGSEDQLIEALQGFDALVLMRERTHITRRVIEAVSSLRVIVTTGARTNVVDMAACGERGVTVCGTSAGTGPVVELAWALVLSAWRSVPHAHATMRSGQWQPMVGRELAGSTIGLVGLGRTGSRMAHVARAFGMTVVAWSPNLTNERALEVGVNAVDKSELFERSDVVSLHLVLSESTRHCVGASELRALGPDGWLVNTSRGALVDDDALVVALEDGTIAGAAIDVYATEPLAATHPLRTSPRVMLTPHIGFITRENYAIWFPDVIEDLVAFAEGRAVRVLS